MLVKLWWIFGEVSCKIRWKKRGAELGHLRHPIQLFTSLSPFQGTRKKTIMPWNKRGETPSLVQCVHVCAVYTVYSWMFYCGQQKLLKPWYHQLWDLFHPSLRRRVEWPNLHHKLRGKVRDLDGIRRTWMRRYGRVEQDQNGSLIMEWIDYWKWIAFFSWYITLGGTHVVTSLLKSWVADFRICILHTFHIWHLYCIWHFAAGGIVIWYGQDIDVFASFFSKHSIWSQLPTQFHPRRRFLMKLTKISVSLIHQSLFLFLTSKSRRPTLLPLKGTKIEEQEHELQNLNSAIAAKVMGFPKTVVTVVFLFRWFDDWKH